VFHCKELLVVLETVPDNKELLAETVPANKELLVRTVPANKELLAGTVPANNELLAWRVPADNLFLFFYPSRFMLKWIKIFSFVRSDQTDSIIC
jgi:hypothetical protein